MFYYSIFNNKRKLKIIKQNKEKKKIHLKIIIIHFNAASIDRLALHAVKYKNRIVF